jgi:hypothetical protein
VRIIRKEAHMAGPSSSTVFHFSWEEIYMAALLETDTSRLPDLIKVAAGTLLDRLLVLTASRGNESEVGAVEDALGSLAVLKREKDQTSRAKEGLIAGPLEHQIRVNAVCAASIKQESSTIKLRKF